MCVQYDQTQRRSRYARAAFQPLHHFFFVGKLTRRNDVPRARLYYMPFAGTLRTSLTM